MIISWGEKRSSCLGGVNEAYEEQSLSYRIFRPKSTKARTRVWSGKRIFELLDMVSRPDEAKMVFMRMLKDVGVFQYQDGDERIA